MEPPNIYGRFLASLISSERQPQAGGSDVHTHSSSIRPYPCGPAFADCNQELKALEQNVVAAGTGASTSETGMTGTKHQEEVLAAKQKSGEPETTGSTAPTVTPTSPHQEQVTKRGTQSAEHANQLIAEARKLSAAGNEQECMKKAAELKDVLGIK